MVDSASNNSDFLQILLKLSKKPINPFLSYSITDEATLSVPYNPFGINEDFFEKEVSCPICLGRVKNAKRPNSCFHSFCSFCINKWKSTSNKCPICCSKSI